MDHVMRTDELIGIARHAGLSIERCDSSRANLYVWEAPDGAALYIGKAATKKRIEEEKAWSGSDYTTNIYSAFVNLVAINRAEQVPLRYVADETDVTPILRRVESEKWNGGAIDSLIATLNDRNPTVEEVENILVRIVVRCGRLIANSQFASQWEGPLGGFQDTFAAIAVDASGFIEDERGSLGSRDSVSGASID